DEVAAFEHQHPPPRAREIRRGHEAVVASPDDDDVVGLGHQARFRSGLKNGSLAMRARACFRRCSTVISIRTSRPAVAQGDCTWARAMYRLSSGDQPPLVA